MKPARPPEAGLRLILHVQPGARRSELAGRHGDAVKIRIAAPPADGAANRELVRFLAELLKVPRSRIEIVSGLGSRRKVVLVRGVAGGELPSALAP